MARKTSILSAVEVRKIAEPGFYFDGAGLYLNVTEALTKSWIYRFMLNGRAREMGLGSVSLVSLKEAREHAWDAKRLVSQGIDPIEDRRTKRAEAQVVAYRKTFKQAVERFVANHEDTWKNPRYATNWRQMMEKHAYPVVGDMWGDEVLTRHVLKVVEPLWNTRPGTGKLVLARMEVVFDDLIVRGERTTANPARWTNYLELSLPKPSLVRPSKPQPSLPHERLFEFMVALRHTDHVGARPSNF